MKVLVAAIPGVRRRTALNNLANAIQQVDPRERVFQIDGDVPKLDYLLYGNDPLSFMNLTPQGRKAQWRTAFERIHERFQGAASEHHILGLHLVYRYNSIPHSAISFQHLVRWRPDLLITLIDDAYLVRQRIHQGGFTAFTLSELLLWRAEEVLVGDLLARTIDPMNPPPNLVVSVKHPSQQLARYLLHPKDMVRVYASYVITDTRNVPERRRIIDAFRMRLYQQPNLLAFDPLTIDELPPLFLAQKAAAGSTIAYEPSDPLCRWPRCTWPAGLAPLADDDDLRASYPLQLPSAELLEAFNAVDAQVSDRDYRLVQQAHYLVVYRPTIAGSPSLSSGVQSEVSLAHFVGCPVIWYIKRGEDPLPKSPFSPKNPESNPNFIYEETEDRFWQKLASLQPRSDRDAFLQ